MVDEGIKLNPCKNCEGRCCSRYLINLCTYDVWMMTRTLDVHPTDFVGFAELKKDSPYDFCIDGSGRKFCMVINMKELPDGRRRCIFALDLPAPVVRCGVYSCRPIACRAYPFALRDDEVVVAPYICPDGGWDTKSLDLTSWRKELQRHNMEFSIHAFLVAKWNARMKSQPEMERLNFRSFFDYLFKIYDELEPVRAGIPKGTWSGIYRQWNLYVRNRTNPLVQNNEQDVKTAGWSLWLDSIRKAVNGAMPNSRSMDKN